jgi:hypothetical protein
VQANKEQWMALCERAVTEEDPEQMAELAAAIIIALRAKQKRLNDLHCLGQRLSDPSE